MTLLIRTTYNEIVKYYAYLLPYLLQMNFDVKRGICQNRIDLNDIIVPKDKCIANYDRCNCLSNLTVGLDAKFSINSPIKVYE